MRAEVRAVGLHLNRPDVEWLEFRRKFMDMGGDGFCARHAWPRPASCLPR